MTRPLVQHLCIMASAGSGKTYQLTHRFLTLMAHGAEPEHIIALTFTRKAAGEFLEAIFDKLTQAANSIETASRLSEELGLPPQSPAFFLAQTRRLVNAFPRLKLGTLDSFFGSILQPFALEFGLTGTMELLDEATLAREREHLLRTVYESQDSQAREHFAQAFKHATWGKESRNLHRTLTAFIKDAHTHLLEAPFIEQWSPPALWQNPLPPAPEETSYAAAVKLLHERIATLPSYASSTQSALNDIVEAFAQWRPGTLILKPIDQFLEKAHAHRNLLEAQAGDFPLYRDAKLPLDPPLTEAITTLVNAVIVSESKRHAVMTRGVYAMLHRYETLYQRNLRAQGRVSFQDILVLLHNGPSLSQRDDTALTINYRLDARYHHWLLDEFQDTNPVQWRILQPLMEEVLQENTGERSFFCVGDIKQSIYGFRGGDPRLMENLHTRYAPALQTTTLSTSYRSKPPVLQAVNTVFGSAEALRQHILPKAAERWSAGWQAHHAHDPDGKGFASLYEIDKDEDAYPAVATLLKTLRPVEHGKSCALILRENAEVIKWVNFLRTNDFEAVNASDVNPGRDNVFALALCALLQAASHPADTLARAYVTLSPLGTCLEDMGIPSSSLSSHVLDELYTHGYAGLTQRWLKRLEAKNALDAFTRQRAWQILAFARDFDTHGNHDTTDFIETLLAQKSPEPALPGLIQVMTIHKAKGLGFDLVILPHLSKKTEGIWPTNNLCIHKKVDRSVDWIYSIPSKNVARHNPVLFAQAESLLAEQHFETLCMAYVAMTRAKEALYIISSPPSEKPNASICSLVFSTLRSTQPETCQWGDIELKTHFWCGNPHWIDTTAPSTLSPEAPPLPLSTPSNTRCKPRLLHLKPSEDTNAPLALSFDTGTALLRGQSAHALLATIEWYNADTLKQLEAHAIELPQGKQALALAKQALALPQLRRYFEHPRTPCVLWREQPFEHVADGMWTSGIFDRVQIDGTLEHPTGALLIDFKSGRYDDSMLERHRTQMIHYAQALQTLLRLPPHNIRSALLFLDPPSLHWLEPA